MGRIRTVKPDLLHHERIATRSDTARLLYYGILGIVDDQGRSKAAAAYLHGQVFWGRPRALKKVEDALTELVAAKIVRVYSAEGGRYLEIIGWKDPGAITHQKVDHPTHSIIPAPSADFLANESREPREPIANGSRADRAEQEQEQEQQKEQEQGALGGPIASGSTPGQDLKATIDAFHVRYVAAYGQKPTWGPAPSKLLKNLIKQHGAIEVQRRIAILFDSPPPWMQPPFTVGSLSSAFDRLVVAVVPRKGPISAARHPNAPADFFGELDAARDDMKRKAGE